MQVILHWESNCKFF